MRSCRCLNCILPPHLIRKLLESDDKDIRNAALETLVGSFRLSGQRSIRATFGVGVSSAPSDGRRSIFDCQGGVRLGEAELVRTEDGTPTGDESVNRAFDGLGKTRDFYRDIFQRNSIDGAGMRLDGYVHRGRRFNNAFWDGQEMVFGDGDGVLFTDFTSSLDVIGHELTHGVTEHTAGLEYHMQPGALNESISDVFGSLVKQWAAGQTAEDADWLIGAEVFTPGIEADALRSMKAPGTAYDNPMLGKDPQPDNMRRFVVLPDDENNDFGGVHINSGIPNKAFYLTAIGIGGHAWEGAGAIWYESLRASHTKTDFQEFADTTYIKAGQLFGFGGMEQKAVQDAWRQVGLQLTGLTASAATSGRRSANGASDPAASLTRQLDALTKQVAALSKDIAAIKAKSDNGRASARK